jgi:hypothetical protein
LRHFEVYAGALKSEFENATLNNKLKHQSLHGHKPSHFQRRCFREGTAKADALSIRYSRGAFVLELRFQIPSRAFHQDIDLLTQSALVLQELSVIKDCRKNVKRKKMNNSV